MVNLIRSWILYIGSGCVSLIVYLLGGIDLLIETLIVLMLIDYATGLLKGYKNKNISSNRSYQGIGKKMVMLLIVAAATKIDPLIPGIAIRTAVAMFYVATEFLSILENAAILGVPIPTKLKVALEQCRDKQDIKKQG